MKNLINEFKNLYTELETEVRKKDPEFGHHKKLGLNNIEKSSLFSSKKEKIFIEACKEMRNILQHEKAQFKGEAVDYFAPTEEIIEILRNIIERIKNPELVKEISIPLNKIYSKKLDDFISPAMKEMSEKIYTHIPILDDNNVVIGVFSENTIFSYLLDEKIIEISEKMTFKNLEKYLDVDKHLSEIFKFVKRNTTIIEAKKIFENELNENKKIGMVFITERGKKDEPILGIFTPWDLAGRINEE